MRIFLAIVFVVITYIIYRMIRHYYRVKNSKDYKIAVGILNNMNYTTPITKHGKYLFSFNLEGFEIKTSTDAIYVDRIKLELPIQENLVWRLLSDPAYRIIDKIHVKAEDIVTKDQRDNEEMTKKDAFISLYKR